MEERNLTQLINRSKSGDLQAIEELLNASYATVAYKCRRMLGNEQDAEDLTQEILVIVYSKLNTLEEPEAYWGWLNRIATNRCYNFLERNHKDLQFAEDEDGNSYADTIETLDERQIPDKAMDNAETARMIDEIVAGLPDAQRAVILMYYYDEMSVKEIAQTTKVPEGTIKRRLDLARNKIEKRVREYEKQGIKLYSISVLPFLWYYLRSVAESEANASVATVAVANVVAGSYATAVSAGSGVAGSATAHVIGTISGKVITGIAAAAILIGGGAVALGSLRENDVNDVTIAAQITEPSKTQPISTTEYQAMPTQVDLKAEALSAYEALLTRGITDQELTIAYYTYIELDQDGIPELLVADADGTPASWTSAELYTYQDGETQYCGNSSAKNDYLYFVNEKYVLSRTRMGNQFITTDGSISTAIYYWNEDMTRNDPAIFYDNGEWEYVSREQFQYYQVMPNEDSAPGFIQTIEPITFKKNEFAPISGDTALQIFNDAKKFYDINIYGRRYIDAKEQSIESFNWIEGVLEYEGCLYQPMNKYTYDEFVSQLRSFFTEAAVAELIKEAGLMEHDGKCYVYIREGVGDPCLDYEVTPKLTVGGYYEMRIHVTKLDGKILEHSSYCCKVDDKWLLDSGCFYGW